MIRSIETLQGRGSDTIKSTDHRSIGLYVDAHAASDVLGQPEYILELIRKNIFAEQAVVAEWTDEQFLKTAAILRKEYKDRFPISVNSDEYGMSHLTIKKPHEHVIVSLKFPMSAKIYEHGRRRHGVTWTSSGSSIAAR